MRVHQGKRDIWAYDQKYFNSVFVLLILVLVFCFFYLRHMNRGLDTTECLAKISSIKSFWPPNFSVEKTLYKTNFTERQKCAFLFDRSVFSICMLTWMLISILSKFLFRKMLFSASQLFLATALALLIFLMSFAGFQEHGIYVLNYTQGLAINEIRSVFDIASFYSMAFFAIYAAVAFFFDKSGIDGDFR